MSAVKSELNRNYSEVTEFILLGLRTPPKLQILVPMSLLIYTVTAGGHSSITVMKMVSRLHMLVRKT